MADIYSINSVGSSVMQFLSNNYPQELRDAYPCDFHIVSSGEMAESTEEFNTSVTLYLYRIIINKSVRNAPAADR
jgi:hypothetical protein